MKKNYLLFLFLPFCIKAQFTYQDLKKSADLETSEATRFLKSKGFNYSNTKSYGVVYNNNNKQIIVTKNFKGKMASIAYFGKRNEKDFNNILETILKLGYKETGTEIISTDFCTNYESTNYKMIFCDGKITYPNYTEAPVYSIDMIKKYY